jgi:hypothetical protein
MRNFVEEDEAREQIMDLTRQRNMPADEVLKQSWLLWKGILNLIRIFMPKNGAPQKRKQGEFVTRWTACIKQPTVQTFRKDWQSLITDYSDRPKFVRYMKHCWWHIQFQFAACYTKYYHHFGITVTQGTGALTVV